MNAHSIPDMTRLLDHWRHGDAETRERLWPVIYGELKKVAHGVLRRQPGHQPLRTTTLVHELYLRLTDSLDWNDRAHFFAIAARAMRFILVDQVRQRRAVKRGGRDVVVPLDEVVELSFDIDVDLVALDDALLDLERVDVRKSQVVELSFFAGLTYEEIGHTLDVSPATVKRDLKSAKMWLLRELDRSGTLGHGA